MIYNNLQHLLRLHPRAAIAAALLAVRSAVGVGTVLLGVGTALLGVGTVLLGIGTVLLGVGTAPLGAQPRPANAPPLHTRAELVAEVAHVVPGQPFSAGVWLRMDPKWHTYWKQAGDAGGPTNISWTLPAGAKADTIAWPLPITFQLADVVSYGYEDSTLLVVTIQPPRDLRDGSSFALRAEVDWIECEQICIPGRASVALTLPVRAAASVPSVHAARFAAIRAEWPSPLPDGASASADTAARGYTLRVRGLPKLSQPLFLTALPFHLEHGAAQAASRRNGELSLTLVRANRVQPAAALPGLLVGTAANGRRVGYEFVASVAGVAAPPVVAQSAPVSPPATPPSTGDAATLTLAPALLLAFVGGLLLNLMPCVLPVIALKVFGFAELGGQDPAKARNHGFAFSAGVIGTFLGLAGVLLAFRAGGAQLGWGFQLQSPVVVALLAALMFVLALSLLGVVEIGAELTQLGNVDAGNSYVGSLLNGALATVVATPCTAPLMGAAIAFGIGQSALVALAVFAALGLGMAAPYAVLASWPAAMRALPKPGKWMVTLKRALSLPMFATVAWLVWVYVQQVGVGGLGPLAVALAATGVGAWIFGKAAVVSTSTSTLWMRRLLGAGFVAVGALVAWGGSSNRALAADGAAPSPSTYTDDYGLVWEPWSETAVAAARAAGRPVFVDFTAAWCLTCKVNERVAFSQASLREEFARRNVLLLRADWTSRSEAIARAVSSFGRQGIPLYVVYPAEQNKPYAVLPEVITAGIVRDYLSRTID